MIVRSFSAVFRALALAVAIGAVSACQSAPKTADDFHREGILQIQKNDLPGALESLDQAVMLESSNPTMLVNRGLVHDELGEYEAAIAAIEVSCSENTCSQHSKR